MPRIKARVIRTKASDGNLQALLQCNGQLPKEGEIVTLKWGSTRTLSQNAFLWVFYTWLIDHGGLKEHGHFFPQALHDNLKAHFLAEKIMSKGQFVAIEEGSTTQLNKSEFSEYFEKVNSFVMEFFGCDTSPFFEEYKEKFT